MNAVEQTARSYLESTLGEQSPQLERAVAVAETLRELGLGPELLAAALVDTAWDSLETDLASISKRFGVEIGKLVGECRKLDELSGAARSNAGLELGQTEKLRQMVLAMVGDARVVVIKLAQQLRALNEAKQADEEQRRQLALDTREIYAPLANRLGIGQIKWELEDFAFRYLEPDEYKHIAKALDGRRTEREAFIEDVVERLKSALAEAGIEAMVYGRPKHIYSIWKKMHRKGLSIDELFDIRALRVQVEDLAACYAALGVVHTLWTPIPKEFDDYIAHPKANFYQSLHTAVIGPEGKAIEVQLRTHDMHRFAEFGVAAHWRYKEGGKHDAGQDSKIAWLRRLLDPTPQDDQDGDPLEQLRTEAIEERVYVFTPAGRVIDLPNGATPLDFAYAVHTQVGHRCRGAKVNGRIVPLGYELSTGEQVEVLTAREPNPSREWLNPHNNLLKTSSARSKVRNWFNRLDKDKSISSGRATVDRELRRLGIQHIEFLELAKRLDRRNADDLFADVGRGQIAAAQIADALRDQLPKEETAEPKRRRRKPAESRSKSGDGQVSVRGVGNLMTQMAQCCQPVAGDPIVGFITQGRGINIHRADCPNMLNQPEEQRRRRIEVEWALSDEEGPEMFGVDIRVEALDRTGLLRDVTTALSNENVNIIGVETRSDKSTCEATMNLSLEVESLAQLSRAMDRVEQLPNIFDVHRLGEPKPTDASRSGS
ncbi:MAG: GTP diphosphokinase [Gammaproteobacteria bacterium]